MSFGLGKKEDGRSFITDITDKGDLEEIEKIAEMLNPNEVFVVARQARLKPGGVFSTSVMFKAPGLINSGRRGKLDQMMMYNYEHDGSNSGGQGEDAVITAIPKNKAENLVEVIRNGMDRNREVSSELQHSSDQPISVADEQAKIAKLKEQGVISESEFVQMKQNLLKRM